ncbi:MAG: NAD(P)H-dependent oxidoreductase subunit E [Planctomycetes bacterium]|nr:NAD(P)H-dependent oxidoreductase subunit E [Planctomycetota bacterium]
MSWKTLERTPPVVPTDGPPVLCEEVREKIRSFFDRYETKRAVLLPALHVVQDALGHVPLAAMVEIADLLDLHPSDVLDTVSFYTHFWTKPKGDKVIVACRSISCEIMGSTDVLNELKRQLGIGEHETTPDGKYSLVTEECLAGCDYAPCVLINERLHRRVKPQNVAKLLADEQNDRIPYERSDLFDAPRAVAADRESSGSAKDAAGNGQSASQRNEIPDPS